MLPPLQVAAFDALSAQNEASLKSQATLHREAVEKLQKEKEQKVNELIRWRGDLKWLNNVLQTNIAQTGKFLEVRRTSWLQFIVLTLHCSDTYKYNSRLRHKMYHLLQPQLYTAPIRTRVLCVTPRICWHVLSASFLVETSVCPRCHMCMSLLSLP